MICFRSQLNIIGRFWPTSTIRAVCLSQMIVGYCFVWKNSSGNVPLLERLIHRTALEMGHTMLESQQVEMLLGQQFAQQETRSSDCLELRHCRGPIAFVDEFVGAIEPSLRARRFANSCAPVVCVSWQRSGEFRCLSESLQSKSFWQGQPGSELVNPAGAHKCWTFDSQPVSLQTEGDAYHERCRALGPAPM